MTLFVVGLRRLYPSGRVEATHPLSLALASLDHVCLGLGCARARRRHVRCSAHCDNRRPAQSGIAIIAHLNDVESKIQ
jgi:hypothetical protein